MLKVNTAYFDDIEALASLLKDSQLRPFRFWNKAIVSLENYSSRLLSGPGRDLIPNHGSQREHVAGAAHNESHFIQAMKLGVFNN